MTTTISATTEAELRELAALYLLRPDVTFLNHGSYGACPRPVFEVYQRWQRELEGEPVEFLGRRIKDLLAEARRALAEFVGTTADHLVFVPNATFGINIVARSLALETGDEVLTSSHEYGAVDRTWRFNCAKRGARYVVQPITVPVETPEAVVEQLWSGVTERTRVIALSHMTSATALIFPIAEICRRARAAGIITVIDGAHAPGHVPLDLDRLDVDFYVGNCHKWLSAPKGAGFLYAAPHRQQLLEPLVISWGWESEKPGHSPFIDHFDWSGTADPSAYLSVPAAITFQREHDWPRIQASCHALLAEVRDQIADLTGLAPLAPSSTTWWRQMSSIPVDPSLAPRMRQLWDEFRVEVPIVHWNSQLFVRVSIQAYNRPEHVDTLLKALRAIYDLR